MKGNNKKSELELIGLLEKEFNNLDNENQTERVSSFLLDRQNEIQSKYRLILKLRLLIENLIAKPEGNVDKKILNDIIQVYVKSIFEIAQKDDIDLKLKSDLIFFLGMIARIQYRQNFETNENYIFRKLKESFQNEKNDNIQNTIAGIFWHLVGTNFPDELIIDLKNLYYESSGIAKLFIKAALKSLKIEIKELPSDEWKKESYWVSSQDRQDFERKIGGFYYENDL